MEQLPASYFDTSAWDRRDVIAGGSRMIPVSTPGGEFRVWTKRVGNNPDLKVLLLHGGPGASDELYECFDLWFPRAGIEYYYYDQLGSVRSDQPDDPSLWTLERFVDEGEQVRQALGLDRDNFVLFGQSWGGLLAMEYAVHHQQQLKALVISNMISSSRLYNGYATDVLMSAMDQDVLAEIKWFESEGKTADPRYEQLLIPRVGGLPLGLEPLDLREHVLVHGRHQDVVGVVVVEPGAGHHVGDHQPLELLLVMDGVLHREQAA